MATYEKGILGPFIGKVGTVVGTVWRGKYIIKSLPKKPTGIPTDLQVLQRDKFALGVHFITPIKSVLDRFFGQKMGVKSRFNLAASYHIKEAIVVNNDLLEIVYPKVLVAKGPLLGLQNFVVTAMADNKLKITWLDNSAQAMAKPTDELLVVLHAPEVGTFEVFESMATRAAGEVTLTVTNEFEGMDVYGWAAFTQPHNKQASTSTYLGMVTIL